MDRYHMHGSSANLLLKLVMWILEELESTHLYIYANHHVP